MATIKSQMLLSFAQFLLYGGLLVFLGVMRKKGAPWLKKLSVIVTEVFAALKMLGELVIGLGYLAVERELFGLTPEQLAVPAEILAAVTGIYLFAMLLLCFMFLGKVPGKK